MIVRLLVRLSFHSIWELKEKSSKSIICRTIYRLYQYENCSSIAWESDFKSEPTFPHDMKSIFISSGAKIGKNCVIFQNVTIGSNTLSDAKRRGAPIIGDNVYIATGVTIVGKIKIGNNVRIGANTVVYKDVPDNCIVTSNEQKNILKNEILDNKYYPFYTLDKD